MDHEYLEYRLSVQPHGPGYKILIYPPSGNFSLTEIPHSNNKADLELLLARAREIVDENIAKIAEARAKRS